MSLWPSKRMIQRMARKDMPDYRPRDNAALQGGDWDTAPDYYEAEQRRNTPDYSVHSIDEALDDLQR